MISKNGFQGGLIWRVNAAISGLMGCTSININGSLGAIMDYLGSHEFAYMRGNHVLRGIRGFYGSQKAVNVKAKISINVF